MENSKKEEINIFKGVKMKHRHKDCCFHTNLGYCEVCKVVYCKDCDKEWVEQTLWITTYGSYQTCNHV